ncbi:hypothetical protein F5144DRAFT_375920 [Chaetomium tenue]|uniref:Uncharacterized protein n=1 Tax=Chaetomium tenue TaxID=1854479 RepID=A0ACB7NZR8_9PEZI|nr:hypothetical protein F5144DRAFT_375920 [Chaetomium globosum]
MPAHSTVCSPPGRNTPAPSGRGGWLIHKALQLQSAMRYLCNLNIYITVEAATLIGLLLVITTSYLYTTIMMARRRRSGAAKAADGKGTAPARRDNDSRPETSPYGSLACPVPFSSPLNVPLDILKKSPKLHAAYENGLPELPTIPQDVGHVLVHYLHTGTYSSLKPRPTETMTKQVCELKTSIQVYAAARAYEMPDLMRLAEAKIDKFGRNLALPTLLEVARDAYPSLTEGDAWFLDYLRARIRPHLKDPATLMGSNLLDQISGILSPNRVLLRTVLELFCERIVVRPDSPAPAAGVSTIASPITSPGSSRPVTPASASPKSLLEMRSRSVVREDITPVRKSKRVTSWTAHDNESEASLSISPEPTASETAPPTFEIQPVPETSRAVPPFAELGPVIFDVMPPPGPPIKSAVASEDRSIPESDVAKIAIEPEVKIEAEVEALPISESEVKDEAEGEVKIAIEPETKAEAASELKAEPEDEVDGGVKLSDDETNEESGEVPVQVPVQAPVEAVEVATEAPIEAPIESKDEVPGEAPRDAPVETEKENATEPETKQQEEEEATTEEVTVVQRERKDSGKGIDLEPLPKELDSIPEHVPEIYEAESKAQPQFRPAVLREADSGFWEGPEVESSKASVVELETVPEPTAEPAHELEAAAAPKEAAGIDTRDFAGAEEDVKDKTDNDAEVNVDAAKEVVAETLPAEGDSAETLVDAQSKDLESQPELAPLPIKSVERAPEQLDDAASLAPEITAVHEQELPETDKSKEVEAQPEPEKVQKETVESEVVAKQEPEPEASSSDAVPVPDDAEPAGPSDAKAAQPSDEPRSEPAAKTGLQRANTDSALLAASRAADAVESAPVASGEFVPGLDSAKTEADGQPCSAQVRQRGWKKRFLSLRYPVLFGRGM